MPMDSESKKPGTEAPTPAPRGEKAFAVFDYAIKVVKVVVVVLGIEIVIIALSGVDMARLDEHEFFQYRMVAAATAIIGYLLFDFQLGRRRAHRARRAAEAATIRSKAMAARDEFALSIDPDADQRAATVALASIKSQIRPKRGFAAEFIALGCVAAGGAAFWHDHRTHDIPNPVAVVGKFVSATCVDRSRRSIAVSGPHMSIGYEFPSQSTQPRTSIKCFLETCEPERTPSQPLNTDYNKVGYLTPQDCRAALPAVLALKAPATVWTGDKDLNAAVRARFTPERHTPPYFLLWIPLLVAAVTFPVSVFMRLRK